MPLMGTCCCSSANLGSVRLAPPARSPLADRAEVGATHLRHEGLQEALAVFLIVAELIKVAGPDPDGAPRVPREHRADPLRGVVQCDALADDATEAVRCRSRNVSVEHGSMHA